MLRLLMGIAALAAALPPTSAAAEGGDAKGFEPAVLTFKVRHALTVKEIPEGARKARVWFWFPQDDDCQTVLDVAVTAPAGFRITRDPVHGHRYLYAEVEKPGATLSLATDLVVRRRAVQVRPDPAKAGPLTDNHRAVLAEHLRRDCPHMEVTDRVVRLAGEICGAETNVVLQARDLAAWVAANTDHYSRPGAPKSSGLGCALYCLDNKGGGCTDQHALFIALCRARGIPTRLHFGSLLKAQNAGKDMDPGYRCWAQYFVPGYGWVPADLSAANTNPDRKDDYVSGLDARRIRFAEGRDLELSPRQEGGRLNLLLVAYAEVDGKPHTRFERVLRFDELPPDGR